jgi:hypothetical protein
MRVMMATHARCAVYDADGAILHIQYLLGAAALALFVVIW